MSMYVYKYICVCVCLCMYINIYIYMCVCVCVCVARQLLSISQLRLTYHNKSRKVWEWFRPRVTAVSVYAILEGNECVVDIVDNC
jgi:uncharacterized membrane protein